MRYAFNSAWLAKEHVDFVDCRDSDVSDVFTPYVEIEKRIGVRVDPAAGRVELSN